MTTTYRPPLVKMTHRRKKRLQELSELIGKTINTDDQLVVLVSNGAPTQLVGNLLRLKGFTRKELNFVIPPRTFEHRLQRTEPLSRDESERAVRVADLVVLSEQVLGSQEAAMSWLRKALKRFGGHSPLEMAQTEQGARLVETMLTQIDEGYFA